MNREKNEGLAFLGRGLGFPPTFDKIKADILMVEAEEDIQQSLEIILSTRPGERALETEFGSNLDKMLFEPINLSLTSYMQAAIKTALVLHESRIEVNDVNIDQDSNLSGQVFIRVGYTVRSTNSRFNFVYPFYIEEGTDVRPVNT